MFDFYQKRKIRAVLTSVYTRIFLLILAVLVAMSAYTRYNIADQMSDRRAEAEREVEELQTRKVELEEKVKYLKDDRGMEAEMRRQFDVALPEEEVVVIVDAENDQGANVILPLEAQTEERKWYEFWR